MVGTDGNGVSLLAATMMQNSILKPKCRKCGSEQNLTEHVSTGVNLLRLQGQMEHYYLCSKCKGASYGWIRWVVGIAAVAVLLKIFL